MRGTCLNGTAVAVLEETKTQPCGYGLLWTSGLDALALRNFPRTWASGLAYEVPLPSTQSAETCKTARSQAPAVNSDGAIQR